MRQAFDLAVKARSLGPDAAAVADRWLFETAVRLHRAGEGAAFTGLKPAGLDVGPVIPAVERALESGSAEQLAELLCEIVRDQVRRRHVQAMQAKQRAGQGLSAAREYVEAALGLQVWAHALYRQAMTNPHERKAAREDGDDGRCDTAGRPRGIRRQAGGRPRLWISGPRQGHRRLSAARDLRGNEGLVSTSANRRAGRPLLRGRCRVRNNSML